MEKILKLYYAGLYGKVSFCLDMMFCYLKKVTASLARKGSCQRLSSDRSPRWVRTHPAWNAGRLPPLDRQTFTQPQPSADNTGMSPARFASPNTLCPSQPEPKNALFHKELGSEARSSFRSGLRMRDGTPPAERGQMFIMYSNSGDGIWSSSSSCTLASSTGSCSTASTRCSATWRKGEWEHSGRTAAGPGGEGS